ncbi:hypothetical protein PV328_005287 [Microctonus aethiopoides]|uniref:Sodium channel protein n=1 Tax=Microctonus aethiopoides TaxID=144406 RepID=A0AA39KS82_9HYME|nr:hypothetical protein PV328_005287 [Microctonus aethiopoides]
MLWNYIRRYIPSIFELLESFKLRSKEYLRENTLHGFVYFINPCRPLWERVIWFIFTITSFCGAVGIIVIIWQRFQSTPTLTDLNIEIGDMTIIYPSIHLCMTSDHLDMTGIPEDLTSIYRTYYNWNWKPLNHTEMKLPIPLSKVFQRITPDCNTLLMDCTEQGFAIDCANLFTKSLTPAGICCKSLSRKLTQFNELPILSFALRKKNYLNLYIHDIDEPPLRHGPIDYQLNRNVDIVLELHITKSDDGLRMLSRAQRDCVFADEGQSYNNCYRECMKKKSLEICKCIPWFEIVDNSVMECNLNQYLCFLNNIKSTDCISECYLLCDHTNYVFVKIGNNKEKTSIGIWKPISQFKREIRFGWLDILVSFGGIMGLFLGYSILTTVELIYYFSLRFYCGAVIDNIKSNKNNNVTKIIVGERKEKSEIFYIKYYDYVD